jgi:hypothetical protein
MWKKVFAVRADWAYGVALESSQIFKFRVESAAETFANHSSFQGEHQKVYTWSLPTSQLAEYGFTPKEVL